jgi:hypothetical protein
MDFMLRPLVDRGAKDDVDGVLQRLGAKGPAEAVEELLAQPPLERLAVERPRLFVPRNVNRGVAVTIVAAGRVEQLHGLRQGHELRRLRFLSLGQ